MNRNRKCGRLGIVNMFGQTVQTFASPHLGCLPRMSTIARDLFAGQEARLDKRRSRLERPPCRGRAGSRPGVVEGERGCKSSVPGSPVPVTRSCGGESVPSPASTDVSDEKYRKAELR